MPDSLPTMLPGNAYTPPDYTVGQSLNLGGVRWFTYEGYAEINTTTGNVVVLRNEKDQPCTIPAPNDPIALSANDPAYVTHISFFIPRVGEIDPRSSKSIAAPVTVGATDVLKLATAANADCTVATTPGVVSGAATGGVVPSGVPSGEAIAIFDPIPGIKLTSAVELKLFSSTNANSSGVAGGNIRVAQGRILVPCRVVYYRKLRSPNLSSIGLSAAQRDLFDRLP